MIPRLAASAALMMLSLAHVLAQDKGGTPGNPPVMLIAAEIDKDGDVVLVSYRTIFLQPTEKGGGGPIYNERSVRKVALAGVKIYGGDGKELTVEAARKLLGGKETPILASADGEKLSAFYRQAFKDDILFFAFPRQAPAWSAIQAPELPVRK